MSEVGQAISHMVIFKDAWMGLIGGAVAYLFDYSKAARSGSPFVFMYTSMFINMTLGAFVAHLVGGVIPSDMTGRDAVIGLSGVTAYQIILVAESKFAEWIMDRVFGKKS